jgi:hypothetical protein
VNRHGYGRFVSITAAVGRHLAIGAVQLVVELVSAGNKTVRDGRFGVEQGLELAVPTRQPGHEPAWDQPGRPRRPGGDADGPSEYAFFW